MFLEFLCVEQLLAYIKEIGDWIKFPDTIHEGLAHLAETLGQYSLNNSASQVRHNLV